MNVSSAAERLRYEESTSAEMMDQAAHDAGLLRPEQHVKARAMASTYGDTRREARMERSDAAHQAGHRILDQLIEHGIGYAGHCLKGWTGIASFGLGGIAISTGWSLGSLYWEAIEKPARLGDKAAAAAVNDSINNALANKLAFHPQFGQAHMARSPEVERGTAAVMAQLDGKDKGMLPVLQARADEGMRAGEKAYQDALAVPKEKRLDVFRASLAHQGMLDRVRDDVAFAKGVEYVLWMHGNLSQSAIAGELSALRARDVRANDLPVQHRG